MKRYRFRPLQELLDLLYPRLCVCCGNALVGDEHSICMSCVLHLPYTHSIDMAHNDTEQTFCDVEHLNGAGALLHFRHGNMAQAVVHQIKYARNRQLAHSMGRMIGHELSAVERFNDVDLIIPVPLHRKKERKRGYNQSELLCHGIQEVFHKPVITDNLIRVVNTESQTKKNKEERLCNMKDVFELRNPEELAGKHIMLVDDVVTTGATAKSCCKALEKADDIRISIIALSKATL